MKGTVVAYLRVSTQEQADRGVSLGAQEAAIKAEVERRGWEIVDWCRDEAVSGGVPFAKRPEGRRALALLRARKADTLMVARLDRFTRSNLDVGTLALAESEGWAIVTLDAPVDSTTASGELSLHQLIGVGQFVRRQIGERTKEALAIVKLRGSKSGEPIGRPKLIKPETEELIVQLRRDGLTVQAIRAELRRRGLTSPTGRPTWQASTLHQILQRTGAPTYPRGRRPRTAVSGPRSLSQ
ncbi:recombinase family protein [Candidatus Nephthysia bennettiae]|uniref:Recombinase family protein n=1 Tax=Candidatus Nephthysia bennettiae TaxID=3127016 RepID=A0A934K4S9_9BACT|nr:recombinase family protein [Candidatus Dormibacteraeota bacterium]MBJ7611920.1 recombinase family protein [Candidatus Dormibacteraeota bacterium]